MQKRQRFSCQRNVWIHAPQGGREGEGYPGESLVGVWLYQTQLGARGIGIGLGLVGWG